MPRRGRPKPLVRGSDAAGTRHRESWLRGGAQVRCPLRPAVGKVAGRHADAGRRHGLRAVEQVQSARKMLQLVGCWLGAGWVLVGNAGCWLRARRCRVCAGSAGGVGQRRARGQRTGSARAAHGQRKARTGSARAAHARRGRFAQYHAKSERFGSPRGIPRLFWGLGLHSNLVREMSEW